MMHLATPSLERPGGCAIGQKVNFENLPGVPLGRMEQPFPQPRRWRISL